MLSTPDRLRWMWEAMRPAVSRYGSSLREGGWLARHSSVLRQRGAYGAVNKTAVASRVFGQEGAACCHPTVLYAGDGVERWVARGVPIPAVHMGLMGEQ